MVNPLARTFSDMPNNLQTNTSHGQSRISLPGKSRQIIRKRVPFHVKDDRQSYLQKEIHPLNWESENL